MTTTDSKQREIAEAYNSFSFTTDQEYQAGLQRILSSDAFNNKSDAEKENALRLSRVFYFNKVTGNSLTLEDALGFDSDLIRRTDQLHQTETGEEARTLTFAELKALIEQGKTDDIPNNKTIPNVLNEAPASESVGQIRKKPWET
ncbi:hypothetical protein BJ322DRAFT_1111983 [Thelephora terrestris]|uniref:Uncharacterized protein n=1 Tax=Thelephora terrestris TaxID=56493 RepID=A0A9P6L366_9AGAM|nr:hypothetical protein BJ322DRAFT_1111983 [Thelephora terrestris]